MLRGSQAPRRAVCGTRGSLRTKHGGGSAPSCCAFTHRVAFDSKWGKEYSKAVYCHPAYLTYMQNTSCEMLDWMKHQLESRFPGEILITPDVQMTPPLRGPPAQGGGGGQEGSQEQKAQHIWKTQQWPQDWKRSLFIPIPKKGNAKECSNYCTIALISWAF